MYQELKNTIRELQSEYDAFPTTEKVEVARLREVDYHLYTKEDVTLLRKHTRALKKVKRVQSKLNKQYAWDKKMENAPKKMTELSQMVKQSTKLFCMDLEFCEKTRVLTEVGVSLYYPKTKEMKTYHFLVSETLHKRNGRHVPDHKDNFQYGDSLTLPLELVEVAVRTLVEGSDYLVGHAFGNDSAFLSQCGYFQNTKVLDTQKYAHYALKRQHLMNLGNVVRETMNEEPEFLHNGGNDAYYTLKSLLAMAA